VLLCGFDRIVRSRTLSEGLYIILELWDEELNVKKIIAVVDATYAVVKIRLTNQLNNQLLVGLLAQLVRALQAVCLQLQ